MNSFVLKTCLRMISIFLLFSCSEILIPLLNSLAAALDNAEFQYPVDKKSAIENRHNRCYSINMNLKKLNNGMASFMISPK